MSCSDLFESCDCTIVVTSRRAINALPSLYIFVGLRPGIASISSCTKSRTSRYHLGTWLSRWIKGMFMPTLSLVSRSCRTLSASSLLSTAKTFGFASCWAHHFPEDLTNQTARKSYKGATEFHRTWIHTAESCFSWGSSEGCNCLQNKSRAL